MSAKKRQHTGRRKIRVDVSDQIVDEITELTRIIPPTDVGFDTKWGTVKRGDTIRMALVEGLRVVRERYS